MKNISVKVLVKNPIITQLSLQKGKKKQAIGSVWYTIVNGTYVKLQLGLPYVRKSPVKYRYLSRIYREIQSFLGPQGTPHYNNMIKTWVYLVSNEVTETIQRKKRNHSGEGGGVSEGNKKYNSRWCGGQLHIVHMVLYYVHISHTKIAHLQYIPPYPFLYNPPQTSSNSPRATGDSVQSVVRSNIQLRWWDVCGDEKKNKVISDRSRPHHHAYKIKLSGRSRPHHHAYKCYWK